MGVGTPAWTSLPRTPPGAPSPTAPGWLPSASKSAQTAPLPAPCAKGPPSGACQWSHTVCPADPTPSCPQVLCGGFAPNTCSSASNCSISQKCCFSGCRKECMEAG
eukprot:TRINITY_DN16181_c0_g4_i2.p3 TRINITY_DN16181_c0_g4~~TRINITY_DN16181_c0_g4_i2.p3  ORF type:complete len:106 (+),score=10.35 TRINITY_DN16181_c0_g4_i2:287-604(+)